MCEEGHVSDNKEWMNHDTLEKVRSIIKTPSRQSNCVRQMNSVREVNINVDIQVYLSSQECGCVYFFPKVILFVG